MLLLFAVLYHSSPNAKLNSFKWITPGRGARPGRLGGRFGRIRLLRRQLRFLQRDLRDPRRFRRPAHLALDLQPRRSFSAWNSTPRSNGTTSSKKASPMPRSRSSSNRAPNRSRRKPPEAQASSGSSQNPVTGCESSSPCGRGTGSGDQQGLGVGVVEGPHGLASIRIASPAWSSSTSLSSLNSTGPPEIRT